MGAEQRRQATLQDIADIVGMSRMSVSRILNGKQKPPADVAERIQAAVVETGYRMNRAASALRQGTVLPTIGMVVDHLADPLFATVAEAAQEVATERGAVLVITSGDSGPGSESDLVEALLARNVDGLLLYPSAEGSGPDPRGPAVDRPMVLLGRSSGRDDVDVVLADNVAGGKMATEHLLAHGHRRIGVIAYGGSATVDDARAASDTLSGRLAGHRSALAAARVELDPTLIVAGGSSATSAAEAMARLLTLPDPPTAVFATNNRMTVGAIRALGSRLRGLALVGIDDFELAEVFDPAITVVTQDPAEMGRRAAEMLFERLDGLSAAPRRVVNPMTLVARGSGEVLAR
ncbi:LacI family DNA-binding transcriptional regulator [Microbacterium xanthum]|uniref:LacI family DNA-binding transcriptional regulator n=1 Tax=Microbacterium xanthum TaxID=3079794 RepID=UPI002AD2EAA0|nr:LacI family DNA-binding transcriptional regulator [Microbacterium sp. KSW-48]MDZ8170656.1 LacI family DNA-binding transcriptional regulator [Microbacterium sp. KSW-48]